MPRYQTEDLQANALKSLHNFRMALDVKANDKNKYKKICEQLSVEVPYFEFSIKPYNPETGKARITHALAKSNDVWKFVAKNQADISISDENLIDFEVRVVALMQKLEAMRIPTKNFKIENNKSENAKRLTPSLFHEIKENVASIMATKNALSGELREAKMATLWGADSEYNIFKKVQALYKNTDLVLVIKSLLKEKNDLKIELSSIKAAEEKLRTIKEQITQTTKALDSADKLDPAAQAILQEQRDMIIPVKVDALETPHSERNKKSYLSYTGVEDATAMENRLLAYKSSMREAINKHHQKKGILGQISNKKSEAEQVFDRAFFDANIDASVRALTQEKLKSLDEKRARFTKVYSDINRLKQKINRRKPNNLAEEITVAQNILVKLTAALNIQEAFDVSPEKTTSLGIGATDSQPIADIPKPVYNKDNPPPPPAGKPKVIYSQSNPPPPPAGKPKVIYSQSNPPPPPAGKPKAIYSQSNPPPPPAGKPKAIYSQSNPPPPPAGKPKAIYSQSNPPPPPAGKPKAIYSQSNPPPPPAGKPKAIYSQSNPPPPPPLPGSETTAITQKTNDNTVSDNVTPALSQTLAPKDSSSLLAAKLQALRASCNYDDDDDESSVAFSADSWGSDDDSDTVTSDASLNSLAVSQKEAEEIDKTDAITQTPNRPKSEDNQHSSSASSRIKMSKSFLEEIRDSAKNRAGSSVIIVASKKKSASDVVALDPRAEAMLERSKVTAHEEDTSSVFSDGWNDDNNGTVTSDASLNSLAVSKKEAEEMDKTDALTQTSVRAKNEASRKSPSMDKDKDQDTSNDSTTPKP